LIQIIERSAAPRPWRLIQQHEGANQAIT